MKTEILHGDCLKIMSEMPDNSVDAIITDPPFAFTGGISNGASSVADEQFFAYWWKDVAAHISRIMKPEAEGFIWCDWRTAKVLADGFSSKQQSYDICRVAQMLYHYREMPGMGRPFRSSVDMIAYLRGPKSKGERIPNTTHNFISKYWYYGKHDNHPAEKDPEFMEMLIDWCSDEGDLVFDPFAGGGSSAIAALRKKRRYLGIERDEDFVGTILRRIEEEKLHLSQMALNF